MLRPLPKLRLPPPLNDGLPEVATRAVVDLWLAIADLLRGGEAVRRPVFADAVLLVVAERYCRLLPVTEAALFDDVEALCRSPSVDLALFAAVCALFTLAGRVNAALAPELEAACAPVLLGGAACGGY